MKRGFEAGDEEAGRTRDGEAVRPRDEEAVRQGMKRLRGKG
jgi:hypothetical protein